MAKNARHVFRAAQKLSHYALCLCAGSYKTGSQPWKRITFAIPMRIILKPDLASNEKGVRPFTS